MVPWLAHFSDRSVAIGRGRMERKDVDSYFLVGAVIGSGLFIFFGGQPARRLLRAIRERSGR